MGEIVAEVVSRCLSIFKLLLSQERGWNEGHVRLSSVQDEFSRFKVWAGNLGAHRTGRSSLEYRLRDASNLQAHIIGLLQELSQLLQDADSILRGEKLPWDKLPNDDDDVLGNVSGDEHSSSAAGSDTSGSDTELGQILGGITVIIDCLFRLSVEIRNPAPHDRFRQSKLTDTSHYEPFDIQHVQTKFPNLDREIAERLGKAISRRRQYFKYREMHHARLSHGLILETSAIEIIPVSTIASSIPEALKQDTSFDPRALNDDAASDNGVSQTSYATSVATQDELRVPPMPPGAHNGPFECPFCYMMIVASSRSSWKRHVFRDLRPYVCLSKDCEALDQEFGERHQWMDHVLQCHWQIWHCPSSGCPQTFDSASSCEKHVINIHPNAFPASQIPPLVKLSERPMDLAEGVDCPICDQQLKTVKQYQRHVGAHQAQLALFALPSTGKDENTDSDSERPENLERGEGDDTVSGPENTEDEDTPDAYSPKIPNVHGFEFHEFPKEENEEESEKKNEGEKERISDHSILGVPIPDFYANEENEEESEKENEGGKGKKTSDHSLLLQEQARQALMAQQAAKEASDNSSPSQQHPKQQLSRNSSERGDRDRERRDRRERGDRDRERGDSDRERGDSDRERRDRRERGDRDRERGDRDRERGDRDRDTTPRSSWWKKLTGT
ncbi:hypothetical protein QBC46DRAFT_276311, partial [Diplogelasinospora grovesii]